MTSTSPHPPHRRSRGLSLKPTALARGIAARPKLYAAVLAGVAAAAFTPLSLPLDVRALIAWDAGAVVYVAGAAIVFSTCSAEEIHSRAIAEDETRLTFFALILLATLSSFWAVVGVIGEGKAAEGYLKALYLALAGLAIVSSWLVLQVVFTLHYAHGYYHLNKFGDEEKGGLSFPGDGQPDYWDFLYFTTSIGAASQTSDVSITDKKVRRLVTCHAILSFAFNTAVVALAINLAAGLL